jgi:hypothetical protein
MRVYVADLNGRSDPYVVEDVDSTGLGELETVLFVSVPRRISKQELDSQLKALHSQWLRASQIVVLRLHSPQAAELLNDEDAAAALDRRFEGLPILVAHLGSDRAIELTPLGEAAPEDFDRDRLIEALRSAELDSWLKRPGVVFPANDDFHYEGPNGCRYESFMRIGTAIQGSEMLDAVAFWLQPYLEGNPIVVLDAWTIISVALNLNRYAMQSGPPCEPVADVECLGAYDEDPEKLRLRLAVILGRSPGEQPPVLLVSSVVSMGNLHKQLEGLISGAGFDELRSVALYGGADSAGTVFCRPQEVGRYWRPDEECPLATPTVPIAPSTYLVEVSTKPKFSRIQKVHAEKAWGFFDRYRDGDFLSVHRDEHAGERHHLIHLDVQRLAGHPKFIESLNSQLDQLPEFDVVLAPQHPAAIDLAWKAKDRLGSELIVADESELSDLPEDDKKKLRDAARILLVDDVVISGTRLLGYRNFLRRCDYVSAENPSEIHLLTGVARVDDNVKLRGIADMVDKPDRFHPVESLLLPDWYGAECPWCWELRQLEELGDEPTLPEEVEKRWDALRDKGRGLRDSLFIPWVREATDPLPVSAWKLGDGSVFHAKSQVELFAAVASAVQSLRAAGDLTEQHRYPLAQVLEPYSWLSGRYYDSVIVAAILRSTRRHDLRTAQIDSELRKLTADRSKIQDLRGELLMAAARGHLPIGTDFAVNSDLLSDPQADQGFADLMREALQGPSYSTAS